MKRRFQRLVCVSGALGLTAAAALSSPAPAPNVPPGQVPSVPPAGYAESWPWDPNWQQKEQTLLRAHRLDVQGRVALRRAWAKEAEATLRRALAIDAHDPLGWAYLAETYERENKERDALAAYRTLIHPGPWISTVGNDPVVRMRYVLALTRSGQWQQAAGEYDQAMAIYLQTEHHALLGLPPVARVLDRDDLVAAAHLVLGSCSTSFDHEEFTMEYRLPHLEAALKLRPKWAEAHYQYARLLVKDRKRYADALAEYDHAAALGDDAMKRRVAEESRGLRGEMQRRAEDPAYRAKQEKGDEAAAPPG